MRQFLSLIIIFTLLILTQPLLAQPGVCNGGGCTGGALWGTVQTTTSPTFVPSVAGTFAGEYNLYNVTAGQQYEWSLCAADGATNPTGDAQLTLIDNTTLANICYADDVCGLSPKILWTATFTGQVRVLINQFSCVTNTNSHTVVWRCAACSAVPSGETQATAISAGTLICNTPYSNTQNLNLFQNDYNGQPSPDVFYTFTLSSTQTVNIGTCGSLFDTYLYLLDNVGTVLASNDNNGPLCAGNEASIQQTLAAGTYYVVSEGAGANTGTVTTSITALGPAPTVTGNTSICLGDTTTLTASAPGATGYTWFDALTGGNTLASTASYTVSPTATTSYYVEAAATGGGVPGPQTMIPIPGQSSTFSNMVRGYYFTSPTTIFLTAIQAPTTASTGNQNLAILRFTAGAPPAWPGTTNNFTVLYLTQNNPTPGLITLATPIQVNPGDIIGVLGNRNDNNSYGLPNPYPSTIAGFPVNLTRCGMQLPLSTNVPQTIWSEVTGGTYLCRVELYYTTSLGTGTCPSARTPVTVTVNPNPLVNLIPDSVNCAGGNDGSITANGSNGSPAYQYSLNGGTLQGTGLFTGLSAGNYTVSVVDANNCDGTATIAVAEPVPLTTSAYSETCSLNGLNYTVTFQVSGGNAPYNVSGVTGTFAGNIFTSNPIPTGTTPTILVSDANNCPPVSLVPVGNCVPASPCNTATGCFLSNQIIDGDFENFDELNPFANFSSTYDYYDCDAGNSVCINGTTGQNILCQYDFAVETGTPACNNTWSANVTDHTSGSGNLMLVDFPVGISAQIWCQTVTLLPNTNYCFGGYFLNLVPSGTGYTNPIFRFEANGQVLGVSSAIPEDEQWHYQGIQFNSGAGGTVTLCLWNDNFGPLGFDLGIDDLSLREVTNGALPIAVNDTVSFCDYETLVTFNVLGNDTGAGINALQLLSYPAYSTGTASANFANGSVTFIPDATFSGSTSFTYEITTNLGCSDVGTIVLTEEVSPVATITGSNTFCQGDSSVLDAGSGYIAYNWTTPLGSANTQTYTATVSGVYSVIVTNVAGCNDTASVTVSLNSVPTPVITASATSICAGGNSVLDAGSGYNAYSWFQQSTASGLGNAQTQNVSTPDVYGVIVTDINGCSGGDTITITVRPNPVVTIIPSGPTSFCPGDSVTLDAGSGFVSYVWSSNPGGSAGNTQTVVANMTAMYQVIVTDNFNCSGIDSISIVSGDTLPPVFTSCPSGITVNNDPGLCGAVVTWSNPLVSDNCTANLIQSQGLASGSVFPAGSTQIEFIVSDLGGNSDTCTFTVTVTDNENPAIVNCPANISVSNDPGLCGAVVNWALPSVTDNCAGATLNQTGGATNGSVFPLGTSTITYLATDAAGNTADCTFTILVSDTENPVISGCPANISLPSDPGACGAIANWTAPSVSDNCAGVTLAQTTGGASGSLFPLGTTVVTYLATDAAGNTANCTFSVTVTDNLAPVIAGCPANIIMNNDPGICGATVNWSVPSVTDNCTGSTLVQTSGGSNGSVFPVGTTTVVYLATDAAGNTSSCQFTVIVNDTENPVVNNCPSNISVTNSPNQCGANVNWVFPTVSDNCPGSAILQTGGGAPGSLFPVGVSTIVFTAADASGNTASCSFTITVTDNQPPVIVNCPSNLTLNTSATQCSAIANWVTPTVTDNCPSATIVQTAGPLSGSPFSLGTTTVSYLATDAAGNTASCSFTVTVTDGVAPVITGCPSNLSVSNNPGQCGAIVNWSVPVANDNCSGVTMIQSSGAGNGSFFPTGTSTIGYQATDAAGNTASCQFTVTVSDTEAPAFIFCPSDIQLTATSGCTEIVNWAAPNVTDNCPGVSLSSNFASGDVFPSGTTTVVYTATDAVGNTSTCSFDITVNVPSPILVTAIADVNVSCNGGTDGQASVSASGGTGSYAYSWDITPPQLTATATGLGAGTYTVYVSDVNAPACVAVATASVTISQPSALTATTSVLQSPGCGLMNGSAVVSASGGTGSYLYQWNTVPPQTGVTATGLGAGTYNVTISDLTNAACNTTASVTLTASAPPTALITPAGTQNICEGNSVVLNANGGSAVSWLFNGAFFASGNTVVVQQGGVYQAIVYSESNFTGCADTSETFTLTVTPLPLAEIDALTPVDFCQGETALIQANGGSAVSWYKDGLALNVSDNPLTVSESGSYVAIVSNGCGADTSANLFITAHQVPVADFIYAPSEPFVGIPVQFTDKSLVGAVWNWDFGNGNTSTVQNPANTYTEDGTYPVTLFLENDIGCSDTVVYFISVVLPGTVPVFIPNVFSPNDDGNFDELILSIGGYTFEYFQVFDRWGKMMFETEDPSQNWRGYNKNGTLCSEGVYFYVLNLKDNQNRPVIKKGNVTLIR